MYVRVYEKNTNTYFTSVVYAKINTGWYERQLVRVKSQTGDYLKFFDYLDKSTRPANVLINLVNPTEPQDWIKYRSNSVDEILTEFSQSLGKDTKFFEFIGFKWLFDDRLTLIKLIKGESVPVIGSIFENRILDEHENGWNYIDTQEDIDEFLKQTYRLHDSILKSVNYISGGYVDADNKSMYPLDSTRKVTFIIDCQMTNSIEIVFEGVTALNLRPTGDNYTSNIFETSLYIKDCTVFFADSDVDSFDESYDGTWITSYGMRWKFI